MKIEIILIIILIFLLIISTMFYVKLFICFSLMTIIIKVITKDIYKAFMISFILTAFFYLTGDEQFEMFEVKEKDEKEIDINKLIKELSGVEGGEINEDDMELINDKTPSLKGNRYEESASAQRETFRLIDTIKTLDDTLKNLQPTLQNGASILEKFKKLNLIKS